MLLVVLFFLFVICVSYLRCLLFVVVCGSLCDVCCRLFVAACCWFLFFYCLLLIAYCLLLNDVGVCGLMMFVLRGLLCVVCCL